MAVKSPVQKELVEFPCAKSGTVPKYSNKGIDQSIEAR